MTVAGIALGIAVVLAIRLANDSSVRGFSLALDTMAGAASLEIVSPGGVDEDRLGPLGWLRDIGDVSAVIEGDAMARAGGAPAEAVRVLGVDILRDRAFREYDLVEFADGRRQPAPQEFLGLLLDPRSVITTEIFARRHSGRSIVLAASTAWRFGCRRDVTSPTRSACCRRDSRLASPCSVRRGAASRSRPCCGHSISI